MCPSFIQTEQEQKERMNILSVRRILLSDCMRVGMIFFSSCFQASTETWILPGSQAIQPLDWDCTISSLADQAFGLRLELNTDSPGFPACWLQILRPISVHNCMWLYTLLVLFLLRTMTDRTGLSDTCAAEASTTMTLRKEGLCRCD